MNKTELRTGKTQKKYHGKIRDYSDIKYEKTEGIAKLP